RLPGDHAPPVFPLDPTFVVSSDRDVSARREIPDHSMHVRGRPLFLWKNEDGGERSYARRARPLEVHPEIIAGEIGRPDGHLRSRLAGMYEIVIRLRTTHEDDHADSEQPRRATTAPPPSRRAGSVDHPQRQGGWSTRGAATRPGMVGDHEAIVALQRQRAIPWAPRCAQPRRD